MYTPMNHRRIKAALLGVGLAVGALGAGAETSQAPELKPDHPDHYTVQKGDTLWGIADRFLANPWRWPQLWQANERIENPHLIYPGDVLVMTTVGGEPKLKVLRNRTVTRLGPQVRAEPYADAIPTVPPGAIQAFLTSPLVIDEGELDRAGYVAIGADSAIVLGKFSVFYGRGLPPETSEFYRIFRPGKKFVDPLTNEFLGVEAQHIGDARMLKPGDTAKMEIVRSFQEVSPGDRMLPTPPEIGLPYYTPHAPDADVRGSILHVPNGVVEAGPFSVVVISLGERENIAPGHVLRILHQASPERDPVTGKLFTPPEDSSGLLMVFRTFQKVSYALIVQAKRPIHIADYVVTP